VTLGEHPALRALARLVEADGSQIVLEAGDVRFTRREFRDSVMAAGTAIRDAGVAAGELVVVQGERNPEFVVWLLGTWAAGAVPVVLDASLPNGRKAQLTDLVPAKWQIDATSGAIQPVAGDSLATPLARNASHILFTTGTTGIPKPVLAGTGALEHALRHYAEFFGVDGGDRFVLVGSIGHDPVLRDILIPITVGGTLVIPPPEAFAEPGRLARVLRERRVSVLHATPALLEFGVLPEPEVPTLRRVLSGGARLSAATARALVAAFPEVRLFNVYGTTETPQIASAIEITLDDIPDDPGEPLPVGGGFGETEVRLQGDPSAPEVVVVSSHLAIGYVSRAGVIDAVSSQPGPQRGRHEYRTGDVGCLDDDGTVRIVGRRDRQAEVNGYRVALEEIEMTAMGLDGVQHASAAIRTTAIGTSLSLRLAVVADASGLTLTRASARSLLKEQLPSYAVPSAISVVPAVLGHNNKSGTMTVSDGSGGS